MARLTRQLWLLHYAFVAVLNAARTTRARRLCHLPTF
jgi:hypothetical protein